MTTSFQALASLSFRAKILIAASLVVLVELYFRRFAKHSQAYVRWTKLFEAIGKVWTAVLLGVIYFLSVSVVSIGMKLLGKDPLDRSLQPETSAWRTHEPNPLGPEAAARHQF